MRVLTDLNGTRTSSSLAPLRPRVTLISLCSTTTGSETSITIRDRPTGRGAQTGSTIGAVAGYAVADGRDRWLGALVGGVLGGAAGNAAEKAKKKKPGWDLIIRLENGEEVGIQVPMNKKNRGIFTPGSRVRLTSGPNGETRVNKI